MPFTKKTPVQRRTNTADNAFKKVLPENSFWQQVQDVFIAELLRETYDHDLYIPVATEDGYPQAEELCKFVVSEREPQCLLLAGQYGVGKTSLLEHFRQTDLAQINGVALKYLWIYVDGNKYATKLDRSPEDIIGFINAAVTEELKQLILALGISMEDFLVEVFDESPDLAPERFLFPATERPDKINKARGFLARSPGMYLDSALYFLTRKLGRGKVILVIDNIDPLGPKAQSIVVKKLIMLAKSSGVKGLVAVRKKTESELRYSDDQVIGQFIRTDVATPSLTEVIKKRVERAVKTPEVQNAKIGEGTMMFFIRDQPAFAELLIRGLHAEGVQRIIGGLANDSVREGLRLALSIYASPHLDTRRLMAGLVPTQQLASPAAHSVIPNHMIVKCLVLRIAQIYDPAVSRIGNIFGSSQSNTHLGPFARWLALRYAYSLNADDLSLSDLHSALESLLMVDRVVIESAVKWLLDKDWLSLSASNELSLTRRGGFMVSEFVYHREYLVCIATDVDMYSPYERRLSTVPRNFPEQVRNLAVLLEYLLVREEEMLRHLSRSGLREYCARFGKDGLVPEMCTRIYENLEPLDERTLSASVKGTIALLRTAETTVNIRSVLKRYCGGEAHGTAAQP